MTLERVWIVKLYCYPHRSEEAGKWTRPIEWPWDGYPRYDYMRS